MATLSHLPRGKARMVDVGAKPVTRRMAVAFSELGLGPEALALLSDPARGKGDALACARLAGVMAAKRVDELVPLCHTLPMDAVAVSFLFEERRIVVRARAEAEARTGVEMEALTACLVAALTLYDMAKSADKSMTIGPAFLARKTGGKSDTLRPGLPESWLDFEDASWQ